ncbi:MAG: putative Ig domain-containing protein, partial [Candidatus Devosia euplotis]|nr:putative Ig domain-containing protein [Candidatus Devosia euplotis]
LAIVTDSLLPGIVGAAYPPAPPNATPDMLQRIVAAGGTGSHNFRLVSTPPPGIELDASGLLQGVAQQAGVYQLDIEVDDGIDTVTKQIPLTVAEPGRLTLVSTLLPNGRIGEEYNHQLRVIGQAASATVTYTTPGPLPDGIVLSPEGRLVGIPQSVGTRQFVVRASEGTSPGQTEDTATFRLTIENAGGFTITPTTIPTGIVGEPYETQLSTRGGTPPYAWRLLGPALHRGIMWSVNAETGAETMTIAGTAEVQGAVSVLVTVTDSRGRLAREAMTLLMDVPPPVVVPKDEGCNCHATRSTPSGGWLFGGVGFALVVRRTRSSNV